MCNKQKFWPVLCDKLGCPELSDDPRFASFKVRLENRTELTRMLDDALSARGTAAWLRHFAGEVPAAPVHDIAQALTSEFVNGEDRIWPYAHAQGDFRMVAPAFRFPGEVCRGQQHQRSVPTRTWFSMSSDMARSVLRRCGRRGSSRFGNSGARAQNDVTEGAPMR